MNKKSTFRSVANNYMTHLKANKGITLVALVITIIVLLILAGVAITTLSGKNNIITQSQRARDDYNAAAIEEAMLLNGYISEIETHTNSNAGIISNTETGSNVDNLIPTPEQLAEATNARRWIIYI